MGSEPHSVGRGQQREKLQLLPAPCGGCFVCEGSQGKKKNHTPEYKFNSHASCPEREKHKTCTF